MYRNSTDVLSQSYRVEALQPLQQQNLTLGKFFHSNLINTAMTVFDVAILPKC